MELFIKLLYLAAGAIGAVFIGIVAYDLYDSIRRHREERAFFKRKYSNSRLESLLLPTRENRP